MKIFIVFAGLLIINMCIISYHGDFVRYAGIDRSLREIARESAEIAAGGDDGAREFAEGLLEYTKRNLSGVHVRSYECDISYDDGFAVARVAMDVGGLFRFPLLSEVRIEAESRRQMMIE